MKEKIKNQPIRYLFDRLKLFPSYLLIATAAEIFATAAALYISNLIGKTLDLSLYTNMVDFGGIIKNLSVIAFITSLGAIFRFMAAFYSGAVSYKTETSIRKEMFEKINFAAINYIDSTPHGDIVSRIINDAEAIGEGIFHFFTQMFSGVTMILGSIILIGLLNFKIMIIVLLLTPILIFTAWLITKFSYKSFRNYANFQGNILGFTEEMISNQFVVNAFNYQNFAIKKFKKINKEMYDYGVKSQFISSLANPSIRFVSWLIYAAVGTAGAYFSVKYASLTIGGISSILIYTAQYTRPFTDIMGIITEIQSALAALNRDVELLYEITSKTENFRGKKVNIQKGEVKIENVFFSYKPGTPIIENFNLNINSGEKIALVGHTGCGKSTIINLLMRFYAPDSGDIKIDGISINKLDLNELRKTYGMVLQDTWLYMASIRDNIAYGKPNASLDDIMKAADMANAHNFIIKLKNGYDTLLSESGNGISQGQKQLISIARVMLIQPKILLLDEATGNIDTRTELKVQNAFNKLMRGKTCIIVAHRLSTIKNADRIVVMDKGKIVEIGNHKELVSSKGYYYNLYNAQISPLT